jgi:hypothetical protein
MASVRSEEEEFERFYRERNAQELLDSRSAGNQI